MYLCSMLHRGVDLRRFYKHFSVVNTVPLVLFAGVFRLFCISWRPRGLDSSPRFFSLQQLSRLLSFLRTTLGAYKGGSVLNWVQFSTVFPGNNRRQSILFNLF